MAGFKIADAFIDVTADTSKVDKDVAEAGDRAGKGFASKFGGALGGIAVATTAAVAGVTALATGAALKLGGMASEASQSVGAIEAVLGSSAKQFLNWTDANAASFGLTEQVANQAVAQYAALGKGLGVAEADLADFGQRGITTAADMAAAFGGDTTEALDALGAGLRGEFNQLEKYGVKLNADMVKRKAAAEGISQAAATELLIQEQLGGVIGQNAREFNTWAATTQRIKANVSNILTAAGGMALPFMELGASIVESLIPAEQLESFFESVSGKAQALADGLRTVFEDAGGGFAGLAAVGQNLFGSIQEGLQSGLQSAVAWIQGGGLTTLLTGFMSWRDQMFTAVLNAVPGIVDALVSILPSLVTTLGTMLTQIVTTIATMAPTLLTTAVQVFTQLVQAAVTIIPQIISTVMTLLPQLLSTILGMLPSLLTAALTLFQSIVTALITLIPQIISTVLTLLPQLLTTLLGMLPTLIQAALTLFLGIVTAITTALPQIISQVLAMLPQFVATILGMLPTILQTAITLFLSIVTAIATALPQIIQAVIGMLPQFVSTIISMIPTLIQTAITLFLSLITGLLQALPQIIGAIIGMFPQIIGALLSAIPQIIGAGLQILGSLVQGFGQALPNIIGFVAGIPGQILGALGDLGGMLFDAGANIIGGLIDGVKSMIGGVTDAIGGVLGAVRDFLPFSPAKKGPFSGKGWTLYSGRSITDALGEGLTDEKNTVVSAARGIVKAASDELSTLDAVAPTASVRLAGARTPVALGASTPNASQTATAARETHLHIHGDVNEPVDVDMLMNSLGFLNGRMR